MNAGELAALVVFGVAVGTYGTLVGAGGGFIVVPFLLLAYGVPAQQAIGTSLVVITLNAISGTVSYARARRIDYRAGWKFALATVPGAAIGAETSVYFTSRIFDIVFGGLLVALAAVLIVRPTKRDPTPVSADAPAAPHRFGEVEHSLTDSGGKTYTYRFNEAAGVAASVFIGFVSSIFGIGGGIIHVPLLVHAFRFPPHVATATSQFILALTATAGVVAHLRLGHVLPKQALTLGIGAVGGAQLGAWLAPRVRSRALLRLLAFALAVAGVRLLLRALPPV